MKYIPLCLWKVRTQIVYYLWNTTNFYLKTVTCFGRYDRHRDINTIFQNNVKVKVLPLTGY